MYVVYWCEHLRDGIEEGAKVWASKEAAMKCIEQLANGFGGCNTTFRLFELGAEIPIRTESVEEPQPAVVKKRYVLA